MALREFKKMVPHQELLKLHNRRKLYKRLHYEKVFKRWDKDNFNRELRELYETTTDEDLVFVPRWFRDIINLVNSFEQHRLSGVEDLLERDFIETRYSRLRLSVIEIYQYFTNDGEVSLIGSDKNIFRDKYSVFKQYWIFDLLKVIDLAYHKVQNEFDLPKSIRAQLIIEWGQTKDAAWEVFDYLRPKPRRYLYSLRLNPIRRFLRQRFRDRWFLKTNQIVLKEFFFFSEDGEDYNFDWLENTLHFIIIFQQKAFKEVESSCSELETILFVDKKWPILNSITLLYRFLKS